MKWLKKTVPSKNATRKKNNGGMTYIELLVALSLLVLVVTVFSPMLLRSYDSLYKAGEMTEFAYDARSKIEEGLSVRENDNFYNIQTNFEKLSDTVSIKARQIVSSVNGLETLYGGARGRIKVVSDSVVSDNQDAQVVRLLVTNLDRDKYTFKRAASATVAQNPGDGEVLFYVCSVFDDTVQLDYTLTEVTGTNFLDVFIKNINITKGPIKFLAYFKDDFGVIKKAETYLYIEPADMMFVGDSGAYDYFTSAGVDAEKGTFYIAGRQMSTAPIGGEMLNDVEWVGTENDSTILDGYYLMCGEDSVVRRLWRARDSSKSANITYKTTAINGNAYFQYDWKGDYTDKYSYMAKKGAGESHYGSSSTGGSDSATKDQYSLKGSSHAFAYNGYAGNWDDFDQKHRRISYVLYSTKDTAAAAGKVPESGMWTYWRTRSDGHTDYVNYGGDNEVAYNISNDTWYLRNKPFLSSHRYEVLKRDNGTTITGFTFDPDPNKSSFVDRKNAVSYGSGTFFRRNGVPSGKAWDTSKVNDVLMDWVDSSVDTDPKVAYLMLKIYNNFSFSDLKNNSSTMVSAPTSNPINLKSCVSLPGKSGDTMYFGITNANALINQTNATSANDKDNRAKGLLTGYFVVGLGEDSNGAPITKLKTYTQSYPENIAVSSISPNSHYAVEQLQGDSTTVSSWDPFTNLAFTMGYASDLYTLYNSFTQDDTKPLENYYKASNGITGINDTVRENIWLPRDFYNIVESDSFEKSVVAVGYNVSGLTQVQYNELYYDADSSTDSQLLRAYHNEKWELNISEAQLQSYDWKACKNNSNLYYLRGLVGDGSDNDFWVKFPKEVVASTAAKTLLNDGVLAIYNENDSNFTNIYYYRDPNEQSVRFNCVSTFGITDSLVGAVVGFSNGRVMLAQIPYVNGKLSTAALTQASCPETGAIEHITSISAVKGFHYDLYGDNAMEMLIAAGGVKADGKALVLRICDVTDLSKYNEYAIQLEATGTNVTEITDIAAVNGYIYISAKTSDNKGVIYSFNMRELKEIVGKGLIENNYETKLITGLDIKKTTNYYTAFSVDVDDGTVIGSGSAKNLPVINSIAAKAEQ